MEQEKIPLVTVSTTIGGDELLLRSRCDISDMSVLRLSGRMKAMVMHLHDKVNNASIPDEKKEKTYGLITLLSDASDTINSLCVLDAKRMSNNFKYVAQIQTMKKQIDEYEKQIKVLKENIESSL